MPESKSGRIVLIAKEIQHYLREHPHACDSVEGIADWWLASAGKPYTPEDVQRALDYLVAEGVLMSTALGGRVVYSGKEGPRH